MLTFSTSDEPEIDATDWFSDVTPNDARTSAKALDPLSIRVISIARDEVFRFAQAQRLSSRMWNWLLGAPEAPHPLADPRLELLRNFSSLVMMGDQRSQEHAEVLLAKGHYSAAQLDLARVLALG